MDPHRRPPSLNLISSSTPASPVSTSPSPLHRQSQSPFRYIHFSQDYFPAFDEKETPLSDFPLDGKRSTSPRRTLQQPQQPSSSRSNPARPHHASKSSGQASPFLRQPAPFLVHSNTSRLVPNYSRPRGLRISNLIKPWFPLILYALTSLATVIAIAFYKVEVFSGPSVSALGISYLS